MDGGCEGLGGMENRGLTNSRTVGWMAKLDLAKACRLAIRDAARVTGQQYYAGSVLISPR